MKHGEGHSEEAVAAIMELPIRDNGDILNLAIYSVLTYTGLRAEHAHAALSKDCEFMVAGFGGPSSPRAFKIHLEYDKNLRAGSSTRVEKEALDKLIPCVCGDQLKGQDLTKFRKGVKKLNSEYPCVSLQCPYHHLKTYMDMIPDPFGAMRSSTNKGDPTLPHLHLFRARVAVADGVTGVRRFLDQPLGNRLDFVFL